MYFSGRIVIERLLKFDFFSIPFLPSPMVDVRPLYIWISAPHATGMSEKAFYIHNAHESFSECQCKEAEDIQAYLGPIVFPLWFYLLISEKQPQLKLRI